MCFANFVRKNFMGDSICKNIGISEMRPVGTKADGNRFLFYISAKVLDISSDFGG